MTIRRDPTGLGPCVLILGTFDGVHRGHQELLMRGGELAEAENLPLYCCTFDPHPLSVLRPDRCPPLLTTLEERAERMSGFGVDALCAITFDAATAACEPEDFIRRICEQYQPRHIVCGYNFTFGCRGSGNSDTLIRHEAEYGYRTTVIGEVLIGGEPVSSTRIRGLLEEGDVREAAHLLGDAYTLSGEVVNGKHIGRTMGFPTANVSYPEDKALPAYGVYACWLEEDGVFYPSVVNVGRHPTLPEGDVTVEANVLDGHPDLYGKQVQLQFLSFIRPERRFADLPSLQAQIREDAETCRQYFESLR